MTRMNFGLIFGASFGGAYLLGFNVTLFGISFP